VIPRAPPPSRSLYLQVLAGIALGVALGQLRPDLGQSLKPLGDGFIKLVKMLIAPIVFTTVVTGIAGMGDLKKVGRVGVKALFYFEVVTSFALVLGLVVVNVLRPGAGVHADPTTLDEKSIATYTSAARGHGVVDFLLDLVPTTVVDAFARGEILQVLLLAVLTGIAVARMGERGKGVVLALDHVAEVLFNLVALVMRLAPLGAFGAMAFTVGKYGVRTLANLGTLMACFYVTSLLFVIVVLGAIARAIGIDIFKLLRYLKDELFVVLGTSSSESVLPRLMQKLEALGCGRSIVGLVVPTGYSFNLDGTSIYLTMGAIFVAQATDVSLSLGDEIGLLLVLLLTSKGAAAVTGGGFVTLAATLSTTGKIPVAGLALLLGIDRFMSEARALTNLVGNAVATLVVARWENELDVEKARRVLSGAEVPENAETPRAGT
jgi:aerobic C4-dicarboxylate transport protein